jgi:hypothetical protein
MLPNQRGISVYTVLSIILFAALVFILALPYMYNLDKDKNVDDCTTYMKNIWVAVTDYMADTKQDFNGDLEVLRNTRKPGIAKSTYLPEKKFCPESQGQKQEYIVFGKYMSEMVGTEVKANTGVLVFCPNLAGYPKHFVDKSFYENMSPGKLQNFMIDDVSYIDAQTKSNGKAKFKAVMDYINLWKSDPEAYNKRMADPNYLKRLIFPDNPDLSPQNTEEEPF